MPAESEVRRANWKQGFNRLFLVAAIGWCAFAVWYFPAKQRQKRIARASDSWSSCLSHPPNAAQLQPDPTAPDPLAEAKEGLAKLKRLAQSSTYKLSREQADVMAGVMGNMIALKQELLDAYS